MIEQLDLKLEMRMALSRPLARKVFCRAEVRSPRTGYVVHTCTIHRGHVDQDGAPNPHVDTHTGASWT